MTDLVVREYEVTVETGGYGQPGPPGPPGPAGRGLEAIKGTLVAPIDLPAEAEIGDAFIVEGCLWIFK